MDASALQFNSADPSLWRDRVVHGNAPESEKIAATTREFESMLLRQYLGEALKPLTKNGSMFGSQNPVYGYLITDSLASGLSAQGVFGFSHLMQAQLAGAGKKANDTTSENL